MRLVLCYDVASDRRRARVHRKLRGHLVPVQESVFEGDCDASELVVFERIVRKELDLGIDAVRVYLLCADCAAKIRLYGTSEPLPDPDVPQMF